VYLVVNVSTLFPVNFLLIFFLISCNFFLSALLRLYKFPLSLIPFPPFLICFISCCVCLPYSLSFFLSLFPPTVSSSYVSWLIFSFFYPLIRLSFTKLSFLLLFCNFLTSPFFTPLKPSGYIKYHQAEHWKIPPCDYRVHKCVMWRSQRRKQLFPYRTLNNGFL